MTPSGPVPRPLSTFLMDDTTRATLAAAGARNSLDVLRMAASGNDTAASVARQAGPAGFSSLSALDSLKRERTRKTISTGSKALDGILGSGFSCGQVVEVAGPPGLGKTQFGMQMCINVQMPVDKGGADGDAIYIDTEGSFSVTRVAEMSLAAIDASCSMIACQPNREQMLDAMLDRIKLFRVHDHVEQIALLNQLEDVIRNNGKIKLIVLDSIAFHFRQGFSDMGLRSRLLSTSAQILRKLAGTYSICILVINQMTTKMVKSGSEEYSVLVPALGDSWGHACTSRIVLYMRNNARNAMLVKSPHLQEATAHYQITALGVRDVD